MEFKTKQEELDYWSMIETAAKNGTGIPDHDCSQEVGCQVEIDYQESRKFWLEQEAEKRNNKLPL